MTKAHRLSFHPSALNWMKKGISSSTAGNICPYSISAGRTVEPRNR
jgi:hypothetical protein